MDDIISMIVIFLIYCAASALGGKKKKKKSRGRMSSRRMEHRPDIGRMVREMTDARGAEQKQATESQMAQMKREEPIRREPKADAARCDEAPGLHLHSVTQLQMEAAEEGEDPCHHGEAPAFEAEDSPIYDQDKAAEKDALMQDMLRGVIMSEILTRPCDKRAMYRNGRRA